MVMNSDQLVSIILMLKPQAQYLEMAIKSIRGQSYQNWELIIVDDLPCEVNRQVLDPIIREESRILYFKNSMPLGEIHSRNKALELAQGRYLAFLECEQIWQPQKLACQVQFMETHKVALSYSHFYEIDAIGNFVAHENRMPQWHDYRSLLKRNDICCATVLLNRDCLKGIAFEMTYPEWIDIWLKVLKKGEKAHCISAPLVSNRPRAISGEIPEKRRHIEVIKRHEDKPFKRLAIGTAYWWFSNSKRR